MIHESQTLHQFPAEKAHFCVHKALNHRMWENLDGRFFERSCSTPNQQESQLLGSFRLEHNRVKDMTGDQ